MQVNITTARDHLQPARGGVNLEPQSGRVGTRGTRTSLQRDAAAGGFDQHLVAAFCDQVQAALPTAAARALGTGIQQNIAAVAQQGHAVASAQARGLVAVAAVITHDGQSAAVQRVGRGRAIELDVATVAAEGDLLADVGGKHCATRAVAGTGGAAQRDAAAGGGDGTAVHHLEPGARAVAAQDVAHQRDAARGGGDAAAVYPQANA